MSAGSSAAGLRVAFLTGQSDPGRTALSPAQHAFLAGLAAPGRQLAPWNFPWGDAGTSGAGANDAEACAWRPVGLWRASRANARQYLAARLGRAPERERALAWLARGPRTVLLTGSCGLALLLALDPPAALRARLFVFGLGAVGPRWPAGIAGACVLGRADRWARLLGPRGGPTPLLVAGGHLDYLESPAVLEHARAALAGWEERPDA